ncbi:MAG: spermine synthase [Opitutaceae bacterium]|nr:spermine synthase [Opitutaceae bacterium]
MKPHRLLAEARTPDGGCLTLHEHDGSFCIRLGGRELMHSKAAASELALGHVGTARLEPGRKARVLIGGLGLGFTLRSALERSGPDVAVEVAELVPAIVEWNRGHLGALNGHLLEEGRVLVRVGDVFDFVRRAEPASYAAILLDIDNGPSAMVQAANARLYDRRGLQMLAAALAPGGRLVVWSAGEDRAFEQRLAQAGFRVETVPVKIHAGARQSAGRLFVGDKEVPTVRASLDRPAMR